jgi:hypothetical protein
MSYACQAWRPPAGFVETRARPSRSTATQNVSDGQAIPAKGRRPSMSAVCQARGPPRGSREAAASPLLPTVTQRWIEGHETAFHQV